MKALEDHAPTCNCDRCAPECGRTARAPGAGSHVCFRKAPHKGDHKCCCGDEWPR